MMDKGFFYYENQNLEGFFFFKKKNFFKHE